jgi:hypothetical protein
MVLPGFIAALFLLLPLVARADMVVGRIQRDMTVGANHDIPLKTGQVVQILNQSGAKTVIMLPLPDGSNGIFEIDASAIKLAPPGTPLGLPAPPPPPPPPPGTVAPKFPDGFAGSATFQTTLGNGHTSGEASIIKAGGDAVYIVSVRQLLGPLGGFAQDVAAKDVPHVVQHIQITPFSGAAVTYDVTGLLVRTKRLKADSGSPIDDLAIYRLTGAPPQSSAVALADLAPAVGDPVWVIARLRGEPPDQLAHRGVITANAKWLEMQFDNSNTITSGAAGAPVLNTAGQVVGVLSGHLTGGGQVRGYLIPAAVITTTINSQPQ